MVRQRHTAQAAERAKQLRKRMTPAEVALWQALRRNQLGTRFRRQEPIGPYIVDFVSLRERLVIELDGADHEFDGPERTMLLHRSGFRVLRFENDALAESLATVIDRIREELGRE